MQSQVQYSQPPIQQPYNTVQQEPPSTGGDMIAQLPSDQTVPSHNEIRIVETLFKDKKTMFDMILQNTKNILVLGVLFIIFSSPPVENLIKKLVTITNKSEYILIGVKALLFMLSYFIVKNIYLVRK